MIPVASWIEFTPSTATIDIRTESSSDKGLYTIIIMAAVAPADLGTVSGLNDAFNFNLEVTNLCEEATLTFDLPVLDHVFTIR